MPEKLMMKVNNLAAVEDGETKSASVVDAQRSFETIPS